MRGIWFVILFAALATALSVSLTSPADGAWAPTLLPTFTYAVDANASTCGLFTNASGWSSVANGAAGSPLSAVFDSDGAYLWAIACADANGTLFWPESNRTLRIDSTPPTVPSGLSVSGNASVNLTWTASSDDFSGVSKYLVWRNGTNVANVTSTVHADTVPSGTTYNYSIQAVDAAGLVSALSAPVQVSGPVASVTISNLAVTTTFSTASFSWAVTPAANASVSFGNGTAVLGLVVNLASSNSASLAIAGLSAAMTYSYNATACAATCATSSGTFRTQPSSYPSPSLVQANGTLAGSFVRFSSFWTDPLALSTYVFSTNASGTWTNSTYAFNGSYGNHSLTLPSTAVTFAWQFYANNSQNAWNATALQYLTVSVPAATATPTPTTTPTATPVPTAAPTATAVPTIPPELVNPTATPAPTAEPVPAVKTTASDAPVATAAPTAAPAPTFSGVMEDFVLDALRADFGLSPTGLVIGVDAPAANVTLSSNFTNQGDELTVQLVADLNGSSSIQLSSQPATVGSGGRMLLQTIPQAVPPGVYDVTGRVIALESGQVLSEKKLKVRVASRFIPDTPALSGLLVVLLAAAVLLGGQLRSVGKEFA